MQTFIINVRFMTIPPHLDFPKLEFGSSKIIYKPLPFPDTFVLLEEIKIKGF